MISYPLILLISLSQPSERQILRDQINRAHTVVLGKIDAVYEAPEINLLEISFNNEFDAQWYWAEIEVEESFLPKGFEYLRIRIIFPASENDIWKNFPKFKVGDEGVFILDKTSFVNVDEEKISILMVLRNVHFQPKEKFEELKKLYINYPPR